ncbi:glycosyltransferase family 2 protein [Fusobacterium sp. MFO224]|uniref:glycosyltransferase family 2 protein n=1 Tax=Fusobacterium sp. MFO224 TaxID=3378070 RepID=UPI0038524021
MNLSVAIITFNEEKILEKTLTAVSSIADEIIIVDSGSTDSTKNIALKFKAKFFSESWKGYGPQRNSAINKCSGDWILNIDADEELSPNLIKKIKEIKSNSFSQEVFKINFTSVCFGKKLKHGGWSNSYRIRLFKKGAGFFNNNTVHEEFITNKKIFSLKEDIYHHSYISLEDYFNKFNRYTTEGALEYYSRGTKASCLQIIFNPMYKFIKMYILRLGFLDGIEGLMIATASAIYSMVKYFKLREIYKNNTYIKK